MLNKAIAKIIGTKYERELKRLRPVVQEINRLEPAMEALSDADLAGKTVEFRRRVEAGETLDQLQVEVFATVREAARRALGLRHYDVQMIGGIVLHQGRIAEMKTGEGKTLVATLAAYLNCLTGKGVHLVTVNDYLARRDSEWMGPVYKALGATVGVIQSNMPPDERKRQYGCDITYGTNNEFGFDYLRDNMSLMMEEMVQHGHQFAIVDEVDSILVDEARTPLIISGPSEQSVTKYKDTDRIIGRLDRGEEHQDEEGVKYTTGDFLVDEKAHTVTLTEEGVAKAEKLLQVDNLYDLDNMDLLHGINNALRAHHLYKRDVNYLIKDNQVVIVDEFTGRMMPGRRWSDGLHQAVEAKENVEVKRENQTLATITLQNYFRMYDKLSGMTGTAATEEAEFGEIYELDVSVIPTHRPMVRDDRADLVFRTAAEKWDAVVEEIADCYEHGQPVLVGTISIENSEMVAAKLKRAGIKHNVLNAKYHGREAAIVAQAGRKGKVTIATNMAGRGTDIVLGGNPDGLARNDSDPEDPEAYEEALERYKAICASEREEVLAAGGLHILGTERHESRRIDNQLRGRSGRQGDPGSSRFFLSLEDDLWRIFGATERIQGVLGRLGLAEGEAIEHSILTKQIERSQTQVEARHFESRKHLLKYDDVMNKQREELYQLRHEVLTGKFSLDAEDGDGEPAELDTRSFLLRISRDILKDTLDRHCPEKDDPRDWRITDLKTDVLSFFDIELEKTELQLDRLGIDELDDAIWNLVETKYSSKEEQHGSEVMRMLERTLMLQTLDRTWKEHLLSLDHLKEGINLRGYGQKDPLNEYKRESFELFQGVKTSFEDTIVERLFRVEPISAEEMAERRQQRSEQIRRRMQLQRTSASAAKPRKVERTMPKNLRNKPCPCGSGKKTKKCHGAPGRDPSELAAFFQ